MGEVVKNLKEALNFFKLPTIEMVEEDKMFVAAAIQTPIITLKNSGKMPHSARMNTHYIDSKYHLCSEKDMTAIIKFDWTDRKKYVSEFYDCDNFAFNFKAMVARRFGINSVGLVIDWSGGHAYNIIAFRNGSMKIFEPQSDSWPVLGSKMYKFEKGEIII